MTTILDYGLGNVQAFLNVYRRLNIPAAAGRTPEDVFRASRLIIPGVGAFDSAVAMLRESGMYDALSEMVTVRRTPTLGVCVGMQILADRSDEGVAKGLGWIPGIVRLLDTTTRLPLPHMGWNDVQPRDGREVLFASLGESPRFYFLHSYYFDAEDPGNVVATSTYGSDFCCAVRKDHVWGVQFHPEKSHRNGMAVLKNFAGV